MKGMSFIISGAVAASLLFAPAATQASTADQENTNIDCATNWEEMIGKFQEGSSIQSILKQIEKAQFGMEQPAQAEQQTETPQKAQEQTEQPSTPAKEDQQPQPAKAEQQPAPAEEQPAKAEAQPKQPTKAEAQPQAEETAQAKEQTEQSADNSAVSAFEKKVVELTNAERTQAGLEPLKLDVELSKVAGDKSLDMQQKNYFSHNSPTYGSPFDMMNQYGIDYRSAGENIAMGQTSPQEVVQGWMNSEGHRKNIMNPSFTHIGVGYVEEGNYWTQMFIGK